MKNRQRKSRFTELLAGACCAAAITFGAQTAFSQQNMVSDATTAPATAIHTPATAEVPWSISTAGTLSLLDAAVPFVDAPPATYEETPDSEEKTAHGGIKVHGHWVIDVKNPDGTSAQHRVFENSLSDHGVFPVLLLSGSVVRGDFAILLSASAAGTSAPCPAGGTATICALVQAKTTVAGNYLCAVYGGNCFPTVTTAVNFGPTSSSVVLRGQFTAPQAGSIDSVATFVGFCGLSENTSAILPDTTISPSACATQTFNGTTNSVDPFTATAITAMPITAGQIVQVSVTISFS